MYYSFIILFQILIFQIWKNPSLNSELSLPAPNPFVPTDFDRREPPSIYV